MNRKLIGLLALLVLPGCVTVAATTAAVPKERATECVKICTDLDMELGALVIIRNSAGCVCSPKGKPATPEDMGAAAAGAVLDDEQQSGTYASQQGGIR
ncbi:hypothetical protein [Myxococcus sp. AB025B]|uniref:hypothetical protein n=1 Tax=Myxococcus TaxID=32 RepID=UPI001144328C|nr:hypothetical protein [Myxococcus sp. AB025B]